MTGSRHYANQEIMGELMNSLSELNAADSTKHTSGGNSNALGSAALFDEMNKGLKEHPDLAKSVKAIIGYVILKNGQEAAKYTLDLKNEPFSVYEGDVKNGGKANTVVTIEDADFVALARGELNPQKAFMSGKLKVKGNIMLLQRLQGIMEKGKAKL